MLKSNLSVKKTGKESQMYYVKCSNEDHKVLLTPKGCLSFLDHPNGFKQNIAFTALNGGVVDIMYDGCFSFLLKWRQGKKLEKQTKKFCNFDPLCVPIKDRIAQMTLQTAKKTLDECSYRRGESSWVKVKHKVSSGIVPDDKSPFIHGESARTWARNKKWSGNDSLIFVGLHSDWYTRVYKRGHASLNGIFILSIVSETDQELQVLAGKQGRGFEVYPALATIKKKDNKFVWNKSKN